MVWPSDSRNRRVRRIHKLQRTLLLREMQRRTSSKQSRKRQIRQNQPNLVDNSRNSASNPLYGKIKGNYILVDRSDM